MSEGRPLVVVLGAADDPPPGIDETGADVRYAATAAELRSVIPRTEVIFAWDYERDLLPSAWDAAEDLEWIQAASAGVDALLFAALVESDVVVTNARGIFDEPMAEYVLGLMLAFVKDFATTFDHNRRGVWQHRYTERLAGKRLLVIGAGSIGRTIGRAARAVGMSVDGVAQSARAGNDAFGSIYAIADLREVLPAADFVVNVLPLTGATRGVFGKEEFSRMKEGARFINVGRGGTADEEALAAALRARRIAGAALDVFEDEPLPAGSPLWDVPGLIVSPHMSGDVWGWEAEVGTLFAENFRRWRGGEPLLNVVDKAAGFVPGADAGGKR